MQTKLDELKAISEGWAYSMEDEKKEPISPEEFEERMTFISSNCDKETMHMCADSLMEEVLSQLGYGKGVDVFKKMPKWYA